MASTWKKVITSGSNAELGVLTTTVGLNLTSLETGTTESRVAVVGPAGSPGPIIKAVTQSTLNIGDTTYAADGVGITLDTTTNPDTFNIDQENLVHDSTFHTSSQQMINAHIDWTTAPAAGEDVITITGNYTNSIYSDGTGIGQSAGGTISDPVDEFTTDATGQVWTSLGTASAAPLSLGSIANGFGTINTTMSIGTSPIVSASEATMSTLAVNANGDVGWINSGQVSASYISTNGMSVGTYNAQGQYVGADGSLEIEGLFYYNTLEFVESLISHMTASQIFGSHATHSHIMTGSMWAPDGITAQSFTGSGASLTNISNNAFAYDALTIGNGLSGSFAQTWDYGTDNVLSVELNNTPGADLDLISGYSPNGNAYKLARYPNYENDDIASIGYPGAGITTITLNTFDSTSETNDDFSDPARRGGYHYFSSSYNMAANPETAKSYRATITCKTSEGSYTLRMNADNAFYNGRISGGTGEQLANTEYQTFTFDFSTNTSGTRPWIRIQNMTIIDQIVSVKDITLKEIVGISTRGAVGEIIGNIGNNDGIYIGNKALTSSVFNASAIGPNQLASNSITKSKLATAIIYDQIATASIDSSNWGHKILVSSPSPSLWETNFFTLRSELVGIIPTLPGFDWTNNGGTVTDIIASNDVNTVADGIKITESDNGSGVFTVELLENPLDSITGLAINNTNWTGSDLALEYGGTNASTANQAATNIFGGSFAQTSNTTWPTQTLTIGNGNDHIYISGSLYVAGTDTTITSNRYQVKDKVITLGAGTAQNIDSDYAIMFGSNVDAPRALAYHHQTSNNPGQKGRLGFWKNIGGALPDNELTHYNAIGVFHTSSATSFAQASSSAAAVEANQNGNILVDNAGDIYFHL